MNVAETYLNDLRAIHATGANVPETSFYGALERLFNEVGKSLSPKVRSVINLQNRGAGIPDGGLFTADQFQRQADNAPAQGQLPSRGAIEVKPASVDNNATVQSEQVRERYLPRYGVVIVTNLREFVIVERAPNGQPAIRERFTLADNERAFWRDVVPHGRTFEKDQGTEFFDFIQRACLQVAPLSGPKDVAWFLASYARVALRRVEKRAELPALQSVRKGLEDALGMAFSGDKGEHFFRSTLIQTVFYGVFSAWVLWHKQNPGPGTFDWRTAAWTLHVPFIRTIYNQLATPAQLGSLNLIEVLDWTAGVLNRVRRAEFFSRFAEDHAVQYFYEPFLAEFDPQLRKDLGVWYTPREIVKYQVARVDRVLREELNIADGLADPNVIVLDPCCGTGAYLVEVLDRIAQTLRERGAGATLAARLKAAATERVFGFEILPAPFVVSHLQLGLLLQERGAALNPDSSERVGVYLTNALTGWQPPAVPKTYLFPELGQEHDAASQVKRDKRILVVLGNPPYNAFAGVSPEEESGLVEPYKHKLNKPIAQGGWGIKKFNLDDLYVRFFRLAERRIAEMSGMGVVSFISNFSYLADPSFVVMRERFLREFDSLWLDCLNGDSRETGKLTPDGLPDPSVFSTDYNREGIRVGTAVCVLARREQRDQGRQVYFRHFWGANKREELLQSLEAPEINAAYTPALPSRENRFSFRPSSATNAYNSWPLVSELGAEHFNGPVERRGGALISIDREPLAERMEAYFDQSVSNEEVARLHASLMMTGNRIVGPEARTKLHDEHRYDARNVVRYPFKVFDVRWAYLANIRPLFSEPSPHLLKHRILGNRFLITRDTADKVPEGPPFLLSRVVCDYDCISGHARHFPVRIAGRPQAGGSQIFGAASTANLSPGSRAYLQEIGCVNPDADERAAGLVWLHALAIGYSPAYLSENADGIRRDWPRVPLPRDRSLLESSAKLGERVAALLDTEAAVEKVTTGTLGPLYRTLGALERRDGEQIDPATDALAVTAGWGHGGGDLPVMPGRGVTESRERTAQERDALKKQADAQGLTLEKATALLGESTLDVFLNGEVFWRNVPEAVWNYYIGGYQVVKKWLSYREKRVLGRNLHLEEADEVTAMIRRLTALVLKQPELDANYRACAAAPQFTIAGPAAVAVRPAPNDEEE